MSRDKDLPLAETDERFPSGSWRGYYVQDGSRAMMGLILSFRERRISGSGRDPIGPFVIRGRYCVEDGEVILHKRYVGAHDVFYRGFAEPQHPGVWGTWDIRSFDQGGFRIWPGNGELPSHQNEAKEAEPLVRMSLAEAVRNGWEWITQLDEVGA